MRDGHLNKCKTCNKKDTNSRYADPVARQRIREYERLRFKDPERKKKVKIYRERMRLKYPYKWLSRGRLGFAVKSGKIEKKPCEVCGEEKSQGHHPDYRKQLEVKWLCFKHHREAHGQKVG